MLFNLPGILDGTSFILWLIITSIFSLIVSYTDIYIFTNLFKIQTSNSKKLKLFFIDSSLNFLCSLFIPAPYYLFINMIIDVLLFRKFFEQSIEKCILGGIINFITVICTEVIFAKIFSITSNNNYYEGMYNYIYKIYLSSSVSLVRFLIAYYLKKSKVTMSFSNHLNNENKFDIIFVSTVCCIFIFFNIERMLMNISDFPTSIFAIQILLLITYFYISIKNVLRIAKSDEKDMKLHNLEEYNKNLSTMYDSVKVFKHDFTNFVQALDGYAQANDIEGIKAMCRPICKESNEVKNLENLNPKIINNPAIYSIMTSKYNLAQEKDISMNIEVMYDLHDIESHIYEICNILGILLDNAIDAAKDCEERIINIRFVKDFKSDNKFIIIENSYKVLDVDIDKIFEKGYSTKKSNKENHGVGLWNVKKVISHCEKLNIFTSKDKLFRQKLEISC